jgi:hypothetical protein
MRSFHAYREQKPAFADPQVDWDKQELLTYNEAWKGTKKLTGSQGHCNKVTHGGRHAGSKSLTASGYTLTVLYDVLLCSSGTAGMTK